MKTALCTVLCFIMAFAVLRAGRTEATILWPIDALQVTPKVMSVPEGVDVPQGVQAVCFEGQPYRGKPTRVFAYYGLPEGASETKPVPGIVLVHGAGGTAFADWVKLWVQRGYAAIAIDTEGNLPIGTYNNWQHDPEGGPRRSDLAGLDQPITDQWMFHAVADTVLAHSLLQSMPGVDPERIGITGISWGAVVMCHAVGIDPRFKFAAAVYGCGYLSEKTDDGSRFIATNQPWDSLEPQLLEWQRLWDPSRSLARAEMPILWIAGANDFAFTPLARQLSAWATKGPRTMCLFQNMSHGHGGPGESPREILAFANSYVDGGTPLATVEKIQNEGSEVTVDFHTESPIRKAELLYTLDTTRWQDRHWQTEPAELSTNSARATLPSGASAWYFNLIDKRGLLVSSDLQLPKPAPATVKTIESMKRPSEQASPEPISIFLVGDSTVCNYPESSNQRGWGQMLPELLEPQAKVINVAKGGLSTKTFPSRVWQRVLATKPEYILIQFGHNDSHAKGNPESTDANTDYKDNLRRYVNEAREAGSTPVLITPVRRRLYRDGHMTNELAPYAEAMKAVAVELDVPLIDLHESSGTLYESLGESASEPFTLNYQDNADRKGSEDRTHFTAIGAREMAQLVVYGFGNVSPELEAVVLPKYRSGSSSQSEGSSN